MHADPITPLDTRADRERRLVWLLRTLCFLCSQLGLALWLCSLAGAPPWVYTLLLGLLILGLVAAVRVLLVFLQHLATRPAPPATIIEREESP